MHDARERHTPVDGRADPASTGQPPRHNPHLEDIEQFAPVEPKPAPGLYARWGHQAILTYLTGKAAMKRVRPIVPLTFLPILRLCADNRSDVDEAYRKVQELNERVRFFDSPYEKYRKMYGSYVREVEWCCVQLRRYFTKRGYEDFVIDTTYRFNDAVMGKQGERMRGWMRMGRTRESVRKPSGTLVAAANRILPKFLDWVFRRVFNPVFWLVGEVEFRSYHLRTGEMELFVKDCLMLRASRMKQLPEETCLLA